MLATRRGEDGPTAVEDLGDGGEQALAATYARWSPLVYSTALAALGNVADAEEVTQRVFTAAWTSRQTFDPARDEQSAWLMGITLSTIAEARAGRSGAAAPRTQPGDSTRPHDTIEPADLAERLVLVDEVSRLDAVPRQVIRMALHDDLTHAQIAERTGLPPATVRSHLRGVLRTLRGRLEVQADAY